MKNILLVTLLLMYFNTSYSQKKEYAHMIDSLGKKYHKNVVGFSRTVTTNPNCQETFIIFYTIENEMYDEIVWSRELLDNNQTSQIIILGSPVTHELNNDTTASIKKIVNNPKTNGIPFYVHSYYNSGALIGFINNRKFIKIKPEEYKIYSVPLWAQKILENNTELNTLLKQKYGGYILL